jgi:FkbM family methyltransferase
MLIRKLLIRLLGFESYLRLISFVFLKTYRSGFFLNAHEQVRFLANLVRAGDTCLDIGANLGYFTVPLSHLVGADGKVLAVEPVPVFRTVLETNVSRFALKNIKVYPYALWEEDGATVRMGTPRVEGVIRHGRTQVLEETSSAEEMPFMHEVQMRSPSSLFEELERLDFVKCDVEGYELHIIPLLLPILQRHTPIIEIEIGPLDHKKRIMNMLNFGGYFPFYLKGNRLHAFQPDMPGIEELYFIPDSRRNQVDPVIS